MESEEVLSLASWVKDHAQREAGSYENVALQVHGTDSLVYSVLIRIAKIDYIGVHGNCRAYFENRDPKLRELSVKHPQNTR